MLNLHSPVLLLMLMMCKTSGFIYFFFFWPGLPVNVCTRNDEVNAECFCKLQDRISKFVNENLFG